MRTSSHPYLAALLLPHPVPPLLPQPAPSRASPNLLLLSQPLQTFSRASDLESMEHQAKIRVKTLLRTSLAGTRLIPSKQAGDLLIMSSLAGTKTLQTVRQFGKTLQTVRQIGKTLGKMGSSKLISTSSNLGRCLTSHTKTSGQTLSRVAGNSPSRLRDIGKHLIRTTIKLWTKADGTCQHRTQGMALHRAFGVRATSSSLRSQG